MDFSFDNHPYVFHKSAWHLMPEVTLAEVVLLRGPSLVTLIHPTGPRTQIMRLQGPTYYNHYNLACI